jgi:hypothetical protein
MASDKGSQNTMATERNHGTVVRMRLVYVLGIRHISVVKASADAGIVNVVEFGGCHHLSEIPEFHVLVFAVREDVSPIAFAINVS